jgi:6-phosphogluconolactonase
MMKQPHYETHEPDILPQRAAELLCWITNEAIETRGVAHIAISGGATPRPLFKLLTQPRWKTCIPWTHTHIWWVDERCVPPDHPDSNYGVAYALMVQHLPVTITHRIRGEETPWKAAQLYEQELVDAFGLEAGRWPRFDLILLGMGDDGHTASLFPNTPSLAVRERLVTVGRAPSPPHTRITLTLPVLNHAAHVVFLVSGAHKGQALFDIFFLEGGDPPRPASLVRPQEGNQLWLLEREAQIAAGLQPIQNHNH